MSEKNKLLLTLCVLILSHLLQTHYVPGSLLGAESRTSFNAATHEAPHFCNQCSLSGHLGCFQFFIITNKAAMSIFIHTSLTGKEAFRRYVGLILGCGPVLSKKKQFKTWAKFPSPKIYNLYS